MNSVKKTQNWIVHVLIFLVVAFFFLKLYPVIPYNGDDWYFTGAMRNPWPMWGVFNPTKVLPEVLEPMGGYVAAFLLYPIMDDYILSISIAQAVIIAFFITFFLFQYNKLLETRFAFTFWKCVVLELMLLFSFFVLFKRNSDGLHYFGFWSQDLNCFFNYQIPGLLNMSLILYMLRFKDFTKQFESITPIKKSILFTWTYLSIFSSIQLSVLLASYCLILLVEEVYSFVRNNIKEHQKFSNNIPNLFMKSWLYWAVIAVWLFSLLMEINGRRANVVSGEKFFATSIIDVVKQIIVFSRYLNTIYILLCLMVLVFSIVICVVKKEKQSSILIEMIILEIIIAIYLILLYAKTGGNYAQRADGLFALIVCGLVVSGISFSIISLQINCFNSILPMVVLFMFIITVNQNYRQNIGNLDYETCKAVDEFIINQILEADRAGLNYVEVKVPYYDNDYNWPHPYNMAYWMQNTLYSHQLIKSRIKVVFIPDESVNQLFFTYDRDNMEKFYDLEAK